MFQSRRERVEIPSRVTPPLELPGTIASVVVTRKTLYQSQIANS
jgi:hypothetical protein